MEVALARASAWRRFQAAIEPALAHNVRFATRDGPLFLRAGAIRVTPSATVIA
jgi:hypothetical protein